MKILVINGPNLELLGFREPVIYGDFTLSDMQSLVSKKAKELNVNVEFFQSNCEGAIIDKINSTLKRKYDGIVTNPAAYTHYSIAIYDALKAVNLPVVEVHLSNLYKREEYRQQLITTKACIGVILGFGIKVYEYALVAIVDYIKNK